MVSEKVRRLQKCRRYLYMICFMQAHKQGSEGRLTKPSQKISNAKASWKLVCLCGLLLLPILLVLCILLLPQGYSDFYLVLCFLLTLSHKHSSTFKPVKLQRGGYKPKARMGMAAPLSLLALQQCSAIQYLLVSSPASPDLNSLSETVVSPTMN